MTKHTEAEPGQLVVLKGQTERWVISPWTSKSNNILVSTGLQFMSAADGEYHFKKGGFALSPLEARELAAALVNMADTVAEMVAEADAD